MPGRALLIGVSEYDSDVIPNLEFVTNDLEALGTALTSVGHEVTTLGIPGHGTPTHNNIITGVHDFCRASRNDETILLYFSGHGLHYQGRDYLAPADASTSDELIERTMVPVDFAASYEQSGASSILFFIDACREGVELGEKGSLSLREWTKGKRATMERRRSAYVFACGPGQVSRYVGGDDGFSLFTRALCETLNSRSTLTFGRATTETQKRLDRLSSRYEKKPQTVRVIAETAPGDDSLTSLKLSAGRVNAKPPTVTEPTFEPDALGDLLVTADDLALLSANLDGQPPWIEGTISIIHVLRGAAMIDRKPQWVLERLSEYEPVGVITPDVDEDALGELPLDSNDAVLLPSSEADGGPRRDTVPVVHVLYAARRLGLSVGAAVERLRRFESVGVVAPDIDIDAVKGLMVDDTDLMALSVDLDGRPPWVGGEVTTIHVLRAANQLQVPVGSVIDRLQRFEPCGIEVGLPRTTAADELLVTSTDLELLSSDLDGEPPWVEPEIKLAHILFAAWSRAQSVGEILRALKRFRIVGYSVPDDDASDALVVTHEDLVPLSVDLTGYPRWIDGPISSGQLLIAAHELKVTLGEIVDRLTRFRPLGLDLPNIDLAQASGLSVTDDDILLLSGGGPSASDWWLEDHLPIDDQLPIAHVLYAAHRLGATVGNALAQAERFRVAGIEVPAVSDERSRNMRASKEDLVLISEDLDGTAPWASADVTWMHLLRAAVALEKPLAQVIRQMRKLRALGYAVPTAASRIDPKFTVSRQDLLLLSRDLDGLEPWAGDQISPIHILRAAHELDQPIGDVVAELERFAPIGITLPEVDWDRLAEMRVAEDDLRLLSMDLDASAPWVDEDVSSAHVLYAAFSLDESVLAVLKRLRQFEAIGIVIPEMDETFAADQSVGLDDLILLSRDLDGSTPWVEGDIPLIHVLRAASRIGEPVGTTLRRVRSLELIGAIRLANTFARVGRRRPIFR